MLIDTEDPVARAVVTAIHTGDTASLRRLLEEHPGLAAARLGRDGDMARSLLHVASDWPGHYPDGASTVALLVEFGADVNARFTGPHNETPLHWAASSDDVAVLDALLEAGADLEATGAVIAGGTPLTDAVAFGQWNAARRLVERGAHTPLREAAALGLLDRVRAGMADGEPPTPDEINQAFWYACHGGQQHVAQYLLEIGAERDWIPTREQLTPLDAARRNGFNQVASWLSSRGARSAGEIGSYD